MNSFKKNEIVYNKMEDEENSNNISDLSWTRKESKQAIAYFIMAFIALLIFVFIINYFLL